MAAVIGALRVNLGLNSAEFEQGMNKAKGALGGLSKAFAALGGAAILAGFTTGIGQAVGRIEETRKLTAQLDRALENTGNTARTSGKEVSDFADRLERTTGRAAEEIMAVSTNLATFGFSREVFFDAIELADDMSAAWGGDLKQNVEGLARALADPEKGLAMLTKRGITFTAEQKNMIAGFMKANDLIGAQGVVLDALNEQVKGVAASGFTGLTKAQANATLAMETFFETIANAMGVNSGLEMSLTAVAAALDFVSANFDVIARGAAVAGAAVVTALGPTIWAVVSGAASAAFTAVVAGLNAVRVAIMTNPIGLIAVALATAVTAAFMSRDEIKQAIGIDFVGIVHGAANNVIGLFVGAYKAVTAAWSLLPAAFGDIFTRAMNGAIAIVQNGVNGIAGALKAIGIGDGKGADLSGFIRDESGALGSLGSVVQDAFQSGFSRDYLGELGKALGLVGDEAGSAATDIAALGAAFDGGAGGVGGGATGGARNLASAADHTGGALQRMGDIGQSVASTLASGFKDIFKAVVTGSGNAMNAVSDLLGRLGDMFLDQGFQALVGGIFGGLFGGGMTGFGGIGNFFKAGGPVRLGFNLLGFEGGGYTGAGGRVGGLDGRGGFMAMLHPNETVIDHTKGQAAGPTIQISITGSKQDAAAIAREVNRVLPDAMERYQRNPLRRS